MTNKYYIENKALFILKSSQKNTTGFYVMNNFINNSDYIKKNIRSSFYFLYASPAKNQPVFIIHTFFNTFKNSIGLIYKILKINPDIVYFTISPVNSFIRDLIYILIIKLFRKEIVYHIHGKGIKNKHDQNKIYQTLYKWAYRNVHVICLSKKLQYDVDYLPLKKIWFIPNAIRNNNINIQEKGKKNNKIQILFLSNLIISKGILDFIGALKILSEKRNDFEGLIIGKERELTSLGLKNKIKNYEDTIKYIGPKYETEKYIYYRNSDIFVFPSYSEIWGIVILEAMQCGLPVITTNEGAITDMIEHGVNGFIVDKQNPQQIANKIEILIDNPQLRKKMGKLNRKKFIENYTIDKFEYNLISVLKSISESYVKK